MPKLYRRPGFWGLVAAAITAAAIIAGVVFHVPIPPAAVTAVVGVVQAVGAVFEDEDTPAPIPTADEVNVVMVPDDDSDKWDELKDDTE